MIGELLKIVWQFPGRVRCGYGHIGAARRVLANPVDLCRNYSGSRQPWGCAPVAGSCYSWHDVYWDREWLGAVGFELRLRQTPV